MSDVIIIIILCFEPQKLPFWGLGGKFGLIPQQIRN